MKFSQKFQIKPGHSIDLKKFNAAASGGFEKEEANERTEKNNERIFKQQYLLYAENERALLIILQGLDTAGKDGVIRHVMRGLNPQGCTVTPFKVPSSEELDHDFLWRIHKAVPAKGDIGIFNRSHYEDVLAVRVRGLISKDRCKSRFRQINHFEKSLTENGVTILKFFLCISNEEQKKRLEERLKNPEKNWKFSENDLKERKLWKEYRKAYEDVLQECSTDWAPWYIIPSDKKWFRNLAVSEIIRETLEKMHLKLPRPAADLSKIKVV